jgi:hypothetical protein
MERPLLKDWQLLGASLPRKCIMAQVIWLDQGGGLQGNVFRTGVQFQGKPAGYTSLIFRYVTMRWKPLVAEES